MKKQLFAFAFVFAAFALVFSAVAPSLAVAAKAPASASSSAAKCAVYTAPTLTIATSSGFVAWTNNTTPKVSAGAYILVQRSVFIDGTDWYWGPNYKYWQSWESLYPKLAPSATQFTDPNPVVGAAAAKYRVVLFNSCGDKFASAEKVI